MTSDITQLLHKGESETVEYKTSRAGLDALARDVCGMLNQQGGVVLWGVDDEGNPLGVDDAETRSQQLNDVLMQQIRPLPLVSVSVTPVADKELVVVDVPPGADKPYSTKREIWVRLGSRTLRADESTSADLVSRSAAQLDRWELAPMPGFGVEDCDSQEVASTRASIGGRLGGDVPANDDELLRRLYLVSNGQFTNAAVVLFAREPRTWAPNLEVRVVSQSGEDGGDIRNDTIVPGPAIRVLREVVEIIQRRTGFSAHFVAERLEREDRPAYALFALREGLVNALVHRDYEALEGVRVDILPDRLVIRNPGRLPEDWTPEDLKKRHESRPANPNIARVFHLRGLMEQLGMGTQKLIEECRRLGAKAPIWSVDRGSVSLTLFPVAEAGAQELEARQLAFVRATKSGEEFKIGDYVHATEISERQARRDLVELERLGWIERIGKGPSTAYRRTARAVR